MWIFYLFLIAYMYFFYRSMGFKYIPFIRKVFSYIKIRFPFWIDYYKEQANRLKKQFVFIIESFKGTDTE
jgi:hypothetical protein